MEPESLTLSELNERIKSTIDNSFPDTYWVIAEISELRVNHSSGHCYLELVEKNEKNERLRAKAKATIWSFTYRMLKPYFETTTGRSLSDGIKVMVKVTVEFHALYALSLNILDIDPSYTVGDLALKKQEILKRLEEEGVLEMNKEIPVPDVPQKIAVVSSETAAGYEDFMNQIENNEFGYVFYTKLFSAVMQGDKAEESIIHAMDKIFDYEDFFDVVVILRGGGSKLDLSCYDNYWLASHIAQFPLPVITGIGHERDDTIADIVANTKLKTPTAVAEFMVNKLYQFEANLEQIQELISAGTLGILREENQLLNNFIFGFQSAVIKTINQHKTRIGSFKNKAINNAQKNITQAQNDIKAKTQSLKSNFLKSQYDHIHKMNNLRMNVRHATEDIFRKNKNRLALASNTVSLVDPQKILQKGYSLTFSNGKVIKEVDQVTPDDILITRLAKGILHSKVTKKQKGQ